MKFLLTATLLTITNAFMLPNNQRRFGIALNLERGDSSEAINGALEASRRFGPSSMEARVAWDIVGEINASDNR